MIVSSFIPAAPGSSRGVDISSRSLKVEHNDQSSPVFSDLLGASEPTDAPALFSGDRSPRSRGMSPVRSGGFEKSGSSAPSAGVVSDPQSSPAVAGSTDAPASEVSNGLSSLGGSVPLPRDPRLDDPNEVAMEAAAIALACVVIQKPQQLVIPLLVPEEQGAGLGGDHQRGGFSAGDGFRDAGTGTPVMTGPLLHSVPSAAVGFFGELNPNVSLSLAASASLDGELKQAPSKQTVLNAVPVGGAPSIEVPKVEAPTEELPEVTDPKSDAPKISVPLVLPLTREPTVSTAPLVSDVSSRPSVESRAGVDSTVIAAKLEVTVVPALVVTANPAETVALVNAGEVLLSGAPADTFVGELVRFTSAVQDAAEARQDSAPTSSAKLALPAIEASSILSDEALLRASLPESPAQAYFAAREAAVSEKSPSPVATSTDGAKVVADGTSVALLPVPEVDGQSADHSGSDSQSAESFIPQSQAKDESPGGDSRVLLNDHPEALIGSAKLEDGVGTLAAEIESVERKVESGSLRPSDVSSEISFPVGDESSLPAASAPVSLVSSTHQLSGSSAAPHEALVRPTVMPPVHTKFGEVFNVVQRALERARSENPSHLAVEVTLDDGSSFGLEVRMSAAGLQASFRSESQSLLKALETGWSNFVSKDAADYKVVSAAFQGRFSSGDFADNKSGGGDRREQFEDNAAAALLRGRNGSAAGQGPEPKSQPSVRAQDLAKGMALYA